MRFEILRDMIQITPETKQDEAYISDTLGLKKDGDSSFDSGLKFD